LVNYWHSYCEVQILPDPNAPDGKFNVISLPQPVTLAPSENSTKYNCDPEVKEFYTYLYCDKEI